MSLFENPPGKKEKETGGWCGSFEGLVPQEDLRIEDEEKVLDFDTDTLIGQILERGGEKRFEGHIIDERFELRGETIAEVFGSAIRIRTFTDRDGEQRFELTLKGRKVNHHNKIDVIEYNAAYETYDGAYEAMLEMLKKHYTFNETDVYRAKMTEKNRISLQLGSVNIDIDDPIAREEGGCRYDLSYVEPEAEFEVLHRLDVTDEERAALAEERDELIRSLGYEPAPEHLQHGLSARIKAHEKEGGRLNT